LDVGCAIEKAVYHEIICYIKINCALSNYMSLNVILLTDCDTHFQIRAMNGLDNLTSNLTRQDLHDAIQTETSHKTWCTDASLHLQCLLFVARARYVENNSAVCVLKDECVNRRFSHPQC